MQSSDIAQALPPRARHSNHRGQRACRADPVSTGHHAGEYRSNDLLAQSPCGLARGPQGGKHRSRGGPIASEVVYRWANASELPNPRPARDAKVITGEIA